MNKSELISEVASNTGLPKNTAEVVVNNIFNTLTDTMAKGDSVSIPGFGVFSVKTRAERTGRNPQTGEAMTIAAATLPAFKAGKALKDAVNQ